MPCNRCSASSTARVISMASPNSSFSADVVVSREPRAPYWSVHVAGRSERDRIAHRLRRGRRLSCHRHLSAAGDLACLRVVRCRLCGIGRAARAYVYGNLGVLAATVVVFIVGIVVTTASYPRP